MIRTNPAYYIPNDTVTIVPNQYGSPRMVSVTTSGTCTITLDANTYSDIIAINSKGHNPSWNLSGTNKVLNPDFDTTIIYIYAKCNIPTNGNYDQGLNATIIFTNEDLTNGTDELYDDLNGRYIYARLGSLSAPINNKRTITLDLGLLDTSAGNVINVRQQAQVIVAQGTSNSANASHAQTASEATHAASAADLDESKQQELDNKYLRKDQDDTTEHKLKVKELEATNDMTVGGNSTVSGDSVTRGDSTTQGDTTTEGTTSTKLLDVSGDSTFHGDLNFPYKEFIQDKQGAKIWKDENNNSHAQFDYLRVNKKWTAEELEVAHIEHVAGNMIFSGAKATILSVEQLDNGDYKCYFKAKDDDGNEIYNSWHAGDYAYCCTLNLKQFKDGHASNAENHYYWRWVSEVSANPVGNFHYIVLSNQASVTQYEGTNGTVAVSHAGYESGSDAPYAGDYVVLRGSDIATRQGTIELNSIVSFEGQGNAPGIFIYNGIKEYNIPQPIFKGTPEEFFVQADKFKLITNGTTTESITDLIDNSVNRNSIYVISGDDAAEPQTTEAFLTRCLQYCDIETPEGNLLKNLASLNLAFYVTTEWRIFQFIYTSATEYSWTEQTDSNMKNILQDIVEQQKILDQITDDFCISENERFDMKRLYSDIEGQYKTITETKLTTSQSEDATILECRNSLETAYADCVLRFTKILDNIPCYFYDATTAIEGATKLPFKREVFLKMLADFNAAIYKYNNALINHTANSIAADASEAAQQSAVEYVQNNISTIVGEGLDNRITNTLIPDWYNVNLKNAFEKAQSDISANSDGIAAVTQSYTKVSATLNGLVTTTKSLFAGTSQTNFVQDKNADGNLLYQPLIQATNGSNKLYWQEDGTQGTTVTSDPVMVGDYDADPVNETAEDYVAHPENYTPRMVIQNTDKSGLVTKDGFAAIFAETVDADGTITAAANMGTYIKKVYVSSLPDGIFTIPSRGSSAKWLRYYASTGKYYYYDSTKKQYYYYESNATISADKVVIASGAKANNDGTFSYNFYLDEQGNVIMRDLWARNITVEGVINNLVMTLDYNRGTNSELVIYKDASKYIGSIAYYTLDMLRIGTYLRILSLPPDITRYDLPYYVALINPSKKKQKRTLTRYGGIEHAITPSELYQLIGRKFYVSTKGGDMTSMGGVKIYGAISPDSIIGKSTEAVLYGYMSGEVFINSYVLDQEYAISLAEGQLYVLTLQAVTFIDKDTGDMNGHGYVWLCQNTNKPADTLETDWASDGLSADYEE